LVEVDVARHAPSGNALAVVALEVGRLARVDVRIAARVRLVLAVGAVLVAVALPRQQNAAARTAPEVVLRTRPLRAVLRLVRPKQTSVRQVRNDQGPYYNQ